MSSALLVALVVLPLASSANVVVADVLVSRVFGDHMVLQAGRPLPVWGPADPGEKVSVHLGEEKRVVTADRTGQWRVTWQAGVEPLVPFDVRGVLWYRGESNAESPAQVCQYCRLFPLLVTDWRKQWGQGDFPFLYVQLPGMGRPDWPAFRDNQLRFLDLLPNSGMVVTIDVGLEDDVHPPDKRPVGERLARWALATTYKKPQGTDFSGPLYDRKAIHGEALTLYFRHAKSGLISSDGLPLRHFELAAHDGVFQPADATIVGDTVRLTSKSVGTPQHARYAWTSFPKPPVNFSNRTGLPASPFTTVRDECIE